MQKDKIKTDLSALFMPRQPPMSNEEAVSTVSSVNQGNSKYCIIYKPGKQ